MCTPSKSAFTEIHIYIYKQSAAPLQTEQTALIKKQLSPSCTTNNLWVLLLPFWSISRFTERLSKLLRCSVRIAVVARPTCVNLVMRCLPRIWWVHSWRWGQEVVDVEFHEHGVLIAEIESQNDTKHWRTRPPEPGAVPPGGTTINCSS